MKIIAIEEHCFTQYFIDYMQIRRKYPRMELATDARGQKIWRWWNSAEEFQVFLPPPVINQLCDLGDGRLEEMDKAGVDVQVISFNPNIDHFDIDEGNLFVRKVNDVIASAINKHPDRFAGLAALSLKDPKEAAIELERAVNHLGFKGAMVLSHVAGEFLDAKKYWPMFEMAAKLDVPIYIHPIHPPPDRLQQYKDYPQLSGSMWGFAAEAGLTAIRLICSGIFDEYPGLKIILGHLGEAIPFWMSRLDDRIQSPADIKLVSNREINKGTDVTPLPKKLKKLPSQYFSDNFYVTTSGVHWEPALICTLLSLGADRILFAADYPFEPSQLAVHFIETATLSNADREKIAHINAEKLLKL